MTTHQLFAIERNMDFFMMKKQQDVSPFLLFEETGDSEASAEVVSDYVNPNNVEMAEDDAESCSWDSADISSVDDEECNISDEDHKDRGVRAYSSYGEEQEEEDDDDEEMSSVYQRWGHQLKSTVSVDSTKEFEMLNEVEKSKLFWETCLAS